MIKRFFSGVILVVLCCVSTIGFFGCGAKPKIGVSIGAGPAARWAIEKKFMEEKASTLNVDFVVKMNLPDSKTTQLQDCKELIDSGIKVLVIMPRNADDTQEILDYAKKNKVKVISYARIILNSAVDLFVGYDSFRIGQSMGMYLSELVYEGDYIILKGDSNDNNATLLYDGAMEYFNPIRDKNNVLLEAAVPNWSTDEAKKMVKEAVIKNNYKVDAILAPNDKLASACAEALSEIEQEFNVKNSTVITGMDCELDAVRRIVRGKQSMTVYMDLQQLAYNGVTQAYNMALGNEIKVNYHFENPNGGQISANLISGQTIIKENVDKLLINTGYFTHEQVYND